jgi:hypothetical protein
MLSTHLFNPENRDIPRILKYYYNALSSIILAGVYFKYLKLIIVICFFYLYINVNVICIHYARCVWGRKRTIKEGLCFTISSPLSGSL